MEANIMGVSLVKKNDPIEWEGEIDQFVYQLLG